MSFNTAGLAAAYQGFQQEAQRRTDEERRVKADARADQDSAYQAEQRGWQRADRAEQDRVKAQDKADIAAVNAEFDKPPPDTGAADQAVAAQLVQQESRQKEVAQAFDAPAEPLLAANAPKDAVVIDAPPAWAQQAAPAAAPVLAPAVADKVATLKAGGIPAPHDFNNTLAKQSALLRRKSDRGDLSPEAYAQAMAFIERARKEGVTDALELMSQGRYDEALGKYNATGAMAGARVIKGEEGVSKINGQDTPTHFVTIANADGTRTTMDVAKARYQLMDLNTQLQHQDRARQTEMQATQHAEQIKLGRDSLKQNAADAAEGRRLQANAMKIQVDQYNASTPLGQITALGQARGKALSAEEIENRLGLSRIPRAVELQVQSLMKESDLETGAMAKAIASPEGINPVAASTFQKNAAIRNERLSQLLAPYSGSGRAAKAADPLGFEAARAGATTVPNPVQQEGETATTTATATTGGVRAAMAGQVAARDQRIDRFNRVVGGANTQRADAIAQRQADVAQNFAANLAAIQPGMSRADAQRVLSWMGEQADAGTLNNEQLRQVRNARRAAGM